MPIWVAVQPGTNQELYRLSRLRDVGDVAPLVLQFAEYGCATLFQVAQSDPNYLRSLALTAQRRSAPRPCNSYLRSEPANRHPDNGERQRPIRDDMRRCPRAMYCGLACRSPPGPGTRR